MTIRTKRVYDPAEPGDGTRTLVDRLWPRGLGKEEARVDLRLKEVAPGTPLRRWFDHGPARWRVPAPLSERAGGAGGTDR